MAKKGKKTWADRIQGLKIEWQKIVWLDRSTVGKQTAATVIVSVILGIIIAVLDMFIRRGVDVLVKL
ncbi:MAG: preprotein translocase subunit SecE [Lachnospiraceae bacterium]|jgi:preprotein translocase subunit SecE|nr:preprotein translocase subunit SecE [Lachnospiraceae bacterium]MDD6666756.1 preprotein translocase subunit SecE [Lachnospiraceae bacterium]